MKQVAAVGMVQVLSASLTGVLAHNKNKFVSRQLLIVMGVMNAVGNLAGSLDSKNIKSAFLPAIFATLAVIAAVVMFIPRRDQGGDIDVALFFTFHGALLAKKGVAETVAGRNFTPVRELFPMILDAKIPLYLCGACARTYGIAETDLVPGVKIITLPTLAAQMPACETITL